MVCFVLKDEGTYFDTEFTNNNKNFTNFKCEANKTIGNQGINILMSKILGKEK